MWDFLAAEWWVPRNQCGWFPEWLVVLYATANVAIWLSYESIPWFIARLERKGVVLFDDHRTTRRFIRFIQFCGRGHLLDGVIVFVWPHYLFFAAWHIATAVISLITAIKLSGTASLLLTKDERQGLHDVLEAIDVFRNDEEIDVDQEIERLMDSASRITSERLKRKLRHDLGSS